MNTFFVFFSSKNKGNFKLMRNWWVHLATTSLTWSEMFLEREYRDLSGSNQSHRRTQKTNQYFTIKLISNISKQCVVDYKSKNSLIYMLEKNEKLHTWANSNPNSLVGFSIRREFPFHLYLPNQRYFSVVLLDSWLIA